MNIGRFSVGNPVLVNVLMIAVLALGVFSAARLPQAQFSQVNFFFVGISVGYPGVSAEDVEESVTVPIENEMQGLNRLDQVVGVVRDGYTAIQLQFEQGISEGEFQELYDEVRRRMDDVDLPDGANDPSIEDISSNDFQPVIEVVLSGDVQYGTLDSNARELKDQLTRIQDVAGVTLVGARDRQIMVELNRSKMESLGLGVQDVVTAIQQRNISIPAGTINTGTREFLLRTVGNVENYEELERVVLRAGPGNGRVTIGDVADVRRQFDNEASFARYNGEQAVTLRVTKVEGGSAVDIVNEAKNISAQLAESLPSGVSVNYFNDSTVRIRDSVDVLATNVLLGLILVLAVLLLFVGFRNALLTAVGIPISFAITFIILESTGQTLNSNTLFGLVLVLGLVVDHAIVIAENSFRVQREEGISKKDAAIKGVNQVIGPVVAATATTIAAFLPLTFLPGVIGEFLSVVPITVTIALIASNIEAGFILPAHYADWPGGDRAIARRERFAPVREWFARVVDRLYRVRFVVIVASVLAFVGAVFFASNLTQNLFETDPPSRFFIDIEMPEGTPIEKTRQVADVYEERLLPLVGNGEVVAVNSSIGFQAGMFENIRNSSIAQITVDLAERGEGRSRSLQAVMSDIQTRVDDIPGPDDVRFEEPMTGPPTDPPVVFRLFGDNYDALIAASDQIKAELRTYDSIFNIVDNLEEVTPELQIRINDSRAADLGLSPQAIGSYIQASFDGITATTLFEDNEETDVIVEYGTDQDFTVNNLTALRIPTPTGGTVPFSTVATVERRESLSSIQRLDGERELQIEAEATTTENLSQINSEIEQLFNQDIGPQYPDVRLELGGEFQQFSNLLLDILRVFLIGLFLIYTILAAQFKSYTQPILIIFTIPLAFVGVALFLLISGTAVSLTILYAGIALVGIAVNDAIVLISFANNNRAEGMGITEAVVDAAKTRLRPVLLTSITTVVGLAPTALGVGGYSVVWGPMASTIAFGLIFSTLSTLIVIPCLYGLFYDRASKRKREAGAGSAPLGREE